MGIPVGSELLTSKTAEIAILKTNRTVVFRDEETSLASAS